MGKYIIGIGAHAGSTWAALVLNRPEIGVLFKHEGRSAWVGSSLDSLKGMISPGDLSVFPYTQYFYQAKFRLTQYDVFGDFNSWPPLAILEVDRMLPISNIIIILRNGISQLYSMTSHSSWNTAKEGEWRVDVFLRELWEFTGSSGKSWDKRTLWEKLCVMWSTTVDNVKCLQRLGFTVHVHYLESLVDLASGRSLRALLQDVSPVLNDSYSDYQLATSQQHDVNRKVPGERSPKVLWERWSTEQQQGFIDICGEGMDRLGYSIP